MDVPDQIAWGGLVLKQEMPRFGEQVALSLQVRNREGAQDTGDKSRERRKRKSHGSGVLSK